MFINMLVANNVIHVYILAVNYHLWLDYVLFLFDIDYVFE
jgi:hypothetical protein